MYAIDQKNAYFGQNLTEIQSTVKVLKNVRKQKWRNAIILSLFVPKSEGCFSMLLKRGCLFSKDTMTLVCNPYRVGHKKGTTN